MPFNWNRLWADIENRITARTSTVIGTDGRLIIPDALQPHPAAGDPTATDDATAGYRMGSQWVNTTTQHAWYCVDPTAGAAVWKQITV